MAGTDHVTLADLSLLTTYSTFAAAGLVDLSPYPELTTWFDKVKKEIPNYEKVNGVGAAKIGVFYKEKAAALGL